MKKLSKPLPTAWNLYKNLHCSWLLAMHFAMHSGSEVYPKYAYFKDFQWLTREV